MDKKVKYNVDKFYFDNHRVTTKENTEEGFPQGEHGLKLYQHKDDEGNIVYSNDKGEYVSSFFVINSIKAFFVISLLFSE